MSRGVVYTAICGNSGDALPKAVPEEFRYKSDVQYVCITDHAGHAGAGWWTLRPDKDFGSSRRTARYYKLNPQQLFPDAAWSIWLDGNISLSVAPEVVLDLRKDHALQVFRHQHRRTVREELKACIKLRKDNAETMITQVERYLAEKFPDTGGLVETGVLVRQHTPQVAKTMELWWDEVLRGSHRDQLSFNYACWRTDLDWIPLPGVIRNSLLFSFKPHR